MPRTKLMRSQLGLHCVLGLAAAWIIATSQTVKAQDYQIVALATTVSALVDEGTDGYIKVQHSWKKQLSCSGSVEEGPTKNMINDEPAHRERRQNTYENIPTNILRSCATKRSFDDVLLFGTNLSALAEMLKPCPCTNVQAFYDYDRYVQQADQQQCYISMAPLEVSIITLRINLTQQCCYNIQGTLQVSHIGSGGYVGTFLLFHPQYNKVDYKLRDKSYRAECCDTGFDRLCDKFMEKRIIGTCKGYIPPPDLNDRIKKKLCTDLIGAFSLSYIGTSQTELARNLDPCPCSSSQADNDHRFIRQKDLMDLCYVSVNPHLMSLPLIQVSLTQQCCYNETGMIVSSGNTAGTMLLYHPHNDSNNYQQFEKSFKEQCCEINSDAHCDLFYSRRMINTCDDYLTPSELKFQEQARECTEMFLFDQLLTAGIQTSVLYEKLDPCPCTRNHAVVDVGRFQQQNDLPQCYVSTKHIVFNSFLARLTLAQQCCYDNNGALVASITEGTAGTILFYHPHYDTVNYEKHDKTFRSKCCEIGSDVHCEMFFSSRQINDCTGFSQLTRAYCYAAQRYQTFDGRLYNFYGNGDFTAMELLSQNDELLFIIQNRATLFPAISLVSSFHIATAFGGPDLAFQFGPGLTLKQTRPMVHDLTTMLVDGETINIYAKATISRTGNEITVAFFETGVVVLVSGREYFQEFLIQCEAKVPRVFSGQVRGLWGNFDGDSTNDFYRRGESIPLSNNLSDQELFPHLLSWRVFSEESLFASLR